MPAPFISFIPIAAPLIAFVSVVLLFNVINGWWRRRAARKVILTIR
jgi:hypothetical protein